MLCQHVPLRLPMPEKVNSKARLKFLTSYRCQIWLIHWVSRDFYFRMMHFVSHAFNQRRRGLREFVSVYNTTAVSNSPLFITVLVIRAAEQGLAADGFMFAPFPENTKRRRRIFLATTHRGRFGVRESNMIQSSKELRDINKSSRGYDFLPTFPISPTNPCSTNANYENRVAKSTAKSPEHLPEYKRINMYEVGQTVRRDNLHKALSIKA
mmetsp:Transcript_59690/g.94778  ORF Transcript_59690/g.94778 Transcript_59690/m.94778 type:complete len:210 (-) Transcript_59690:6-635(-)